METKIVFFGVLSWVVGKSDGLFARKLEQSLELRAAWIEITHKNAPEMQGVGNRYIYEAKQN